MRIGIVEAEVEFSRLLKLSLQMAFYEKGKRWAKETSPLLESLDIYEFPDGVTAAAELEHTRGFWEVIFVDLQPQPGQALEFITLCNRRYRGQYGRLIVLTERGDRDGAGRGLESGAEACLYKPFTLEEILPHLISAEMPGSPATRPDSIQPGGVL